VPKNKTHSGIKKRVKITGSSKLLSQHSGMRHNQERKPSTLTRRLTGTKQIAAVDAPRVKKLLGR
jgi:large subunit ribosomal protein L35